MEEEKSEQINLEYKVAFDDGLKNRAVFYSIDSDGNFHIADVFYGISVEAGFDLQVRERGCLLNKFDGYNIDIMNDRGMAKGNSDLEKEILEQAKTERANVIKVQNASHIPTAIKKYASEYQEQFDELKNAFSKEFGEFIESHPGYLSERKIRKEVPPVKEK